MLSNNLSPFFPLSPAFSGIFYTEWRGVHPEGVKGAEV